MIKTKQLFHYLDNGVLNVEAWLAKIKLGYQLDDVSLLAKASALAQQLGQGLTTFYGQSCIEQGLEVAEIILNLKLDQETAAAAIISCATAVTEPNFDLIKKEMGDTIAKLVIGIQQIETIPNLQQSARNKSQLDKLRKMLLALSKDIRVVIIKLAERLCVMREIKSISDDEKKKYAQEILDIYAPLANRLGIGQIKGELEDLALRYSNPIIYKEIATFLAERRVNREERIKNIIVNLKQKLQAAHVHGDVTGRAKHIYSIYMKSQRKDNDLTKIYDASAVRVLVPDVQDCYTALGIVNGAWPPIMEEFDDYIANPKQNGYRSIHTAVIDEDGKHFEIQIRTHNMHEEAERGVAAHWMYKEKKSTPVDDATKVSYLRSLLDWHKEVVQTGTDNKASPAVIDDQIYAITPAGDILDLPQGATPIDFAYHVHSELGHRCRGAKVNGQIVPLIHQLKTGDRVEIITALHGGPSRDWLNAELGYVKTNRTRNKISHWFKQQALNDDITEGKEILERELSRQGLAKTTSLSVLAKQFNLKDENSLFVSLARGNIRIGQVLQIIQPKSSTDEIPPETFINKKEKTSESSAILGASDLLTRFARCCKPIPGDMIIGYITQGRGISIHKKSCNNIKNLSNANRFMPINWDSAHLSTFSTDLRIIAEDQKNILHDITALFSNEKIDMLRLHSTFNKQHSRIYIDITIQVQNTERLQRLLHNIQQLPGILGVARERG